MRNDEGLIRPVKREADPEVGPEVIMAMIPSDLDYLVKLNRGRRITRFDMTFFNLYQIDNGEACFSLSGPFLGAPQSVMGMEKLIALGAQRIWILGWCGSLSPDLLIGDILIPTGALSEEGTSTHYPIGKMVVRADEDMNRTLEHAMEEQDLTFCKGTVWTTDAPYRETLSKVKKYMDKGVMAVEMEMSALMTLSIYRNVKLAGLLTVSDELFDLKWNPGFSSPKLKETSRMAGKLLIDLVGSLR